MARKASIHIGLNSVDPRHYSGWDGKLQACEADAHDMHAIAKALKYDTSTVLLTRDATAEKIMGAISQAAGGLDAGDMLLLSYSGHGGQVPDVNGDEKKDSTDETWVAYDRQIVDDELYALWATFKRGVRIFMLSDSCHSGSVSRAIDQDVPDPVADRETAAKQEPRLRAMPRDVQIATYEQNQKVYDDIENAVPHKTAADVHATVLLISGCRDDQLSSDGWANGLFTENLRKVWGDGTWDGGGYKAFRDAIVARMPADQQPQYSRVGARDAAFEKQRPFTDE
jgi:metacaspase-1